MFVVEFDHRSDDGDRIVGPFDTAEEAEEAVTALGAAHMASSDTEWRAEYSIVSLAAVVEEAEALEDDEMPLDELEEGEEEITEIPVHGVATVEGIPTGDGRGFRDGSLFFDYLPQPLGYEFTSTHGGTTSEVAIVGRIDRFELVPTDKGYTEARWWGVIMPHKPHAGEAIDGIVDGSYTGVSVIVDSVTEDVSEERERMLAMLQAEARGEGEDGERKPLSEYTPEELEALVDEYVGDGTQPTRWFSRAQIRRFDMVPTGAFAMGFIALGHEFMDELTPAQIEASVQALADCGCLDDLEVVDVSGDPVRNARAAAEAIVAAAMDAEDFAPGTKDGPGWITHPTATARIRRYWVRGKGAAKIKWGVPGDFNRCRLQLAKYVQNPEWLAGLCANMHKEALGVWPGQEGGGRGHALLASGAKSGPLFALVASPAPVDAKLFERVPMSAARGVVIDGDHIYGYIAQWNVCHVGQPEGPGTCTLAPHSAMNYAYYRTGTVHTTDGPIAVGSITMGTGHAGGNKSAASAVAHYDNTGTVVADVAVGEDSIGIWYSGRVRPNVTDEARYALAASGQLSGDWRVIGSEYEMIGALVVNVGGFPIPNVALTASAAGGGISLIAAGMVDHDPEAQPDPKDFPAVELTAETVAGIAVAAVESFILQTKRAEDLDAAREAVERLALANARRKFAQESMRYYDQIGAF